MLSVDPNSKLTGRVASGGRLNVQRALAAIQDQALPPSPVAPSCEPPCLPAACCLLRSQGVMCPLATPATGHRSRCFLLSRSPAHAPNRAPR